MGVGMGMAWGPHAVGVEQGLVGARALGELIVQPAVLALQPRVLLAQAQVLETAQSGAQSPPDARSDPQLWERVAYKDNTHIVCARGGAAFACVADALQQLTMLPHSPGVTLILLPGVYTEQLHFENVQVQLA